MQAGIMDSPYICITFMDSPYICIALVHFPKKKEKKAASQSSQRKRKEGICICHLRHAEVFGRNWTRFALKITNCAPPFIPFLLSLFLLINTCTSLNPLLSKRGKRGSLFGFLFLILFCWIFFFFFLVGFLEKILYFGGEVNGGGGGFAGPVTV